MKRIFVLLSVLASCLAVFLVVASLTTSRAQTVTDEIALRLLPVPTKVTGTTIRGVSNDGKRIVFDSINDYIGKNADSNTEIYVYDVDSAVSFRSRTPRTLKTPTIQPRRCSKSTT